VTARVYRAEKWRASDATVALQRLIRNVAAEADLNYSQAFIFLAGLMEREGRNMLPPEEGGKLPVA